MPFRTRFRLKKRRGPTLANTANSPYTNRMSLVARDGPQTAVWRTFACVLLLAPVTASAAPVDLPPVEAPVGSGISDAGFAAAVVTAPALAAPSFAAPSVLVAPAALPALAPAAAATDDAGFAPTARPEAAHARAFGRKMAAAPSAAVAVGANIGGEQSWAQGAALFDLSAAHADHAPAPGRPSGLPDTPAGRTIARLRLAAQTGAAGPAAIAGMAHAQWSEPAGGGRSGETTKVLIAGKTWYLKRLGPSPDAEINATPPETRAGNEAGLANVLREDPQLSRSFSVAPRVSVFRDGKDVYVLSEGLPAVGNGESQRHDLSAAQRADAAIIQLALGLGDMHGADVLPLGGGRFGLIDFEKLSRAALTKASAHEIDEQVMLKNYPLVDRLSENDPAVYRARFETWRADYFAGGRGRMDAALAAAGWTTAQREVYLAAVDRNIETYLDRLEPYLEYANGWHRRIQAARAQAARPPPRKGFWQGLFGSDR